MITLVASTRRATAVSDDAITTRSVGIPVALDLSEHFDGLAVTLVCKAGEVSRDIAVLDPDALEVPVDCLQVAGVPLLLGLVGKNAAGTVVIRTIMASAGTIRVGTEESDVDPSDPVPDWTAQVQQWAEDAHDTAERLAQEVDGWQDDIDAAVEGAEAVDATVEQGDGSATVTVTDRTGARHTATVRDGATGPAGADGYSPTATVTQLADGATISITDKDGTTTATIHDGADGATGPEGPAGYSPSARVTQTASGATITVTDQSGTTTADISNGAPGEPGQTGPIGPTGADGYSPTVDVQPITGGHEVTITDADGAHSFDVMDGDPSAPGSITDEMLAPDGIKPQVAQLFGNQLTGELSGTIDTTADAYAAPPMALTVDGASTQAGTPTPDAPVEILSVDDLSLVMVGKNLFDYPTEPFTNKATSNYNGYAFAGGFRSIPNGVTTITASMFIDNSAANDVSGLTVWTHNSNGVVVPIGTSAIAAGSMGRVSRTYDVSNYNDFALGALIRPGATVSQLMAELGSTATEYEPYIGVTAPIDLQDHELRSLPDGTKDELNLSYLRPSTRDGWAWYSRELVQRVWYVDDVSTLAVSSFNANNKYITFNAPKTGVNTVSSQTVNVLCPNYPGSRTFNRPCCYVTASGAAILFGNDDFADRATAESMLSGVSFDYALATPITTTLDPIELPTLPAPTATVWCDGGSATPSFVMEYVKDANLVVQQLTAETAIAYASIAAQDGPTATASHAIGTYLTMGGTLYKVTRAIAVGETIAAGTNVTTTTVMAELLARTA